MYTNQPEKLSEVSAYFNGGSDHKLLMFVRYAKNVQKNARYITRRCFKYFKQEDFMADIKKLRWFDIYMSNDVNVAVNSITQKVTLVLDKYAPVRTI